MKKRIVIVGGVAAGMSCATRLRRLNEHMEIVVLDKGEYVSFANCGMPYYVGQEIKDRNDLLVNTPEGLKKRYNLDVRTKSEVTSFDGQKKVVYYTRDGKQESLYYDALVLAPGAKPFAPNIPGKDRDYVFTLRSINDMDAIVAYIQKHQVKQATVIGAGFIGMEMAENLAHLGIGVRVVEFADHILPSIDKEMAVFLEEEVEEHGIDLYLQTTVVEIGENYVKTADDELLETDFVLLSTGVRADSEPFQASGIKTNQRGSILVDEHFETNIKDVYAVGDAIAVKQRQTGELVSITLASPANRQGRLLADILSGIPRKNNGSLGTGIVRIFEQTFASTGLSEATLLALKKEYAAVHVPGKNHTGYFPGSKPIFLKLLFHPKTGEIYGAQAIGEDGVDKRIDVIATAINGKLSVYDLVELELTYAPPFGSAKDLVNMAGYVALNIMDGLSQNVQWHELKTYQEKGALVLDVRNEHELHGGKIHGSIHIPLDELREKLDEIPKGEVIIVSCQSGLRSYMAERILKQNGYDVRNLDGAFELFSKVLPEDIDSWS